MKSAALLDSESFSLVLGGPLFRLWRRAHLSGDTLELLKRRIVIITLIAWLPLLLLSALEGQLFRGSAAAPFLLDVGVHVRFLVAVPLLIGAELLVHQRLRPLIRQFLDRQIIPDDATEEFDAAIRSSTRLRDSVLAEVLQIALVYGVGVLVIWRSYVSYNVETWFAVPSEHGPILSYAGMWYGYVSLPIFQFLLCRWYYRLAIWARFLWLVSRIKLNLIPTHPDRLAGLGFLPNAIYAFAPIAVAHGFLMAGQIGNRILYLGATLPEFKVPIAALAVVMMVIMFAPLMLFTPQLAQAKRDGNREYGILAARYVREYDWKWLRGGAPADEAFVGSSDIQSLADLGNSMEVVRTMNVMPVSKDSIVRILAAVLLPIAPLTLTMMPLEELLKMLFGLVF